MKLKTMATLSAVALVFGLSPVATSAANAQTDYLSVTLKNTSNMTVRAGIQMVNGQYVWKTLAPGQKWSTSVQHFFFAPFIQGQQTVRIAINFNGQTRTGTLPIFRYQWVSYAGGNIFRRSPGVPGLQNASGPP